MNRPLHDAAIVAVGSELLGPTRVDTNSLKITKVLEDYGVELVAKSVAGDRLGDVAAAIRFALDRADVVVMTGGLGPTEDDLTREALASALGLTMELDPALVERLEQRFATRGIPMPEVNKRQANVFPGQQTLINERGTAPGFHIVSDDKHIWVFPGVPSELEWMLETYFGPWLAEVRGARSRYRRVLKIAGITESGVEEKLAPYYAAHRDEFLTILASPGGIELHLSAEGNEADAREWMASREAELVAIFGDRIFGYDDDTLESVIGELLVARGATLATAESCTGGMMSTRLTDVPGSSRYYLGGGICYSAKLKTEIAGVDEALIREHGEVSEQVAVALARGIRERFGATYGVGVTGVAGPGGGSEAKPVGTVHIAVATPERAEHRKLFWPSTRPLIRWYSTQAGLDLLRRTIIGG